VDAQQSDAAEAGSGRLLIAVPDGVPAQLSKAAHRASVQISPLLAEPGERPCAARAVRAAQSLSEYYGCGRPDRRS